MTEGSPQEKAPERPSGRLPSRSVPMEPAQEAWTVERLVGPQAAPPARRPRGPPRAPRDLYVIVARFWVGGRSTPPVRRAAPLLALRKGDSVRTKV